MKGLRYDDFMGQSVAAFTSDSGVDFLSGDQIKAQCFALTSQQRDILDEEGFKGAAIFPKQVHGDVIWEVAPGDAAKAGTHEADAVITATPGLAVAVRTADCLPLLMFSADKLVVAAVHAGWKSTRLEIASKTVVLMRHKYGVDPAGIRAVIGPCIRRNSYPVGVDFKMFFPFEVVEREGFLYFDIAAANCRQLICAGVCKENIFDCGYDTYSDSRWHSFRRDGDHSGRMIHAIMIKSGAV